MKTTVSFSRTAIACLMVMLMAISAARADFTYSDLTSIEGLNLIGSATQNGSVVRIIPATTYQLGAFWKQGLLTAGQGFATTFRFQATNIGGALDADGNPGFDYVAFMLQNISDNLNITDLSGYDPAVYPRLDIFLDGYKNAGSTDISSSSVITVHSGEVLAQSNLEAYGIVWRDQAVHEISVIYAEQVRKVLVDNIEVVVSEA